MSTIDGPLTTEIILLATGEFDPASVYQLILKNARVRALDGASACINLAFLDLYNNDIAHLHPLSLCTQLLHLDIRSNRVGSLRGLSGCAKLRRILAEGNSVGSLTEMALLELPASLRHLSLQTLDSRMSNPVTTSPNYRVDLLSALPSLQTLDHLDRQLHGIGMASDAGKKLWQAPEQKAQLLVFDDDNTPATAKAAAALDPVLDACDKTLDAVAAAVEEAERRAGGA